MFCKLIPIPTQPPTTTYAPSAAEAAYISQITPQYRGPWGIRYAPSTVEAAMISPTYQKALPPPSPITAAEQAYLPTKMWEAKVGEFKGLWGAGKYEEALAFALGKGLITEQQYKSGLVDIEQWALKQWRLADIYGEKARSLNRPICVGSISGIETR